MYNIAKKIIILIKFTNKNMFYFLVIINSGVKYIEYKYDESVLSINNNK